MSTNLEPVRVRHVIFSIRDKDKHEYSIQLYGEDSLEALRTLVRRGLNCFPEAPPEMKELGDVLDHGKILQDYWSTRTDLKIARPEPEGVRVLSQEEVDKRYVNIK